MKGSALLWCALVVCCVADSIPILSNEMAASVVAQPRFAAAKASASAPTSSSMCDVTAEAGICLFNGQKIIVPDAFLPGTIAKYTFDDGMGLDYSPGQHHGSRTVPGVGRDGGSSARFEGRDNFFMVPENEDFKTTQAKFSLSFWIYLTTPVGKTAAVEEFCPVVAMGHKGESTFTVNVNSATQALSVGLVNNAIYLTSLSRLHPQRWYNIYVIRNSAKATLYVNGVLDSFVKFQPRQGGSSVNSLYVGSSPDSPVACAAVSSFIDNLQLFNVPVPSFYVAAEAYQALGAADASKIRLGCKKCTFQEGLALCQERGWHTCYESELLAGGFAAAANLRWIDNYMDGVHVNDIFDADSRHVPNEAEKKNPKRAAVCCK